MKPFDSIETFAQESGQRHANLSRNLIASMQTKLLAGATPNAASARELKQDMVTTASFHLDAEREFIRSNADEIALEAHTSALSDVGISDSFRPYFALSDAYRALESKATDFVVSELVSQIDRDVSQLSQSFRKAGIEADISSKAAPGISFNEALADIVTKTQPGSGKLFFFDRVGRRIQSSKFVRRMWREALRDHYILTYMDAVADRGETSLVIWHEDKNHRAFGETISLDGSGNSIGDFEDVFHPNSTALPVTQLAFERMTA